MDRSEARLGGNGRDDAHHRLAVVDRPTMACAFGRGSLLDRYGFEMGVNGFSMERFFPL